MPKKAMCMRVALGIARNTTMSALDFDWFPNLFCKAVVEGLRSNKTLRILSMSGRYRNFVGVAMAEALGENATLRAFRFQSQSCGDKTGVALAKALDNNLTLQSFTFCGRRRVGDVSVAALAAALQRNVTLRSFELGARDLNISYRAGMAMADALRVNANLLSFKLQACSLVGDEICVALAHNCTLQSFSLSLFGPSVDICEALALALQWNRTLRSFSLYVAMFTFGDEAGLALADALVRNATLQSFSFEAWGTAMSDATGVAMARALGRNATVQSFKFQEARSEISDATGVAMGEVLKRHATLRSFAFRSFTLGDKTGVAMAEALTQNAVLRSFALEARVSDVTGVAIAEAMNLNVTLRSLTFQPVFCSSRSVSDVTGVALAGALRQNTSLQSFTFNVSKYGRISEDHFRAVMDSAFRQNVTLLACRVGQLRWDISCGAVAEYVVRNQAVRAQMRTLAQLARWSENTGFHSLVERCFRSRILAYFLPPLCKWTPFDFVGGMSGIVWHPCGTGRGGVPGAGGASNLSVAVPCPKRRRITDS